jgi:hypothetical protein
LLAVHHAAFNNCSFGKSVDDGRILVGWRAVPLIHRMSLKLRLQALTVGLFGCHLVLANGLGHVVSQLQQCWPSNSWRRQRNWPAN